jgi:hypothetical protein
MSRSRQSLPKIALRVHYEGPPEETITIGTVEPPTINNLPIYQLDGYLGQKAANGEWINIHDALDSLWHEFCQEQPDSDSEFIVFLTNRGWREFNSSIDHTFEG